MDSKNTHAASGYRSRSLIAKHGAGRLEMHRTRPVLFLKARPKKWVSNTATPEKAVDD